MVLAGYMAFLDPPRILRRRPSRRRKLRLWLVKVLLGDNEIVTRGVCNWVGIHIAGLLTGAEANHERGRSGRGGG